MTKIIQLSSVSIKYSGENIGDDIRIEIETPDIHFSLNKTIKNGTNSIIKKQIGNIALAPTSSILPLTIKIIEKDTVYKDVGNIQAELKIDPAETKPQKTTYTIKVREAGWPRSKSEALFDITLETKITDIDWYIEEQNNGFLQVIMEDGTHESLPAFLGVLFHYSEDRRDYFTILEGVLKGKKGSMKQKKDGRSYILVGNPHTNPVQMSFPVASGTLTINNKKYKVIKDLSSPWKKGLYDIEIPDHIHELGKPYLNEASKAMVWFHVGHEYQDERYIHTGKHTAGCITLSEIERWDEIYNALIKARKSDSKSIGTLEILD